MPRRRSPGGRGYCLGRCNSRQAIGLSPRRHPPRLRSHRMGGVAAGAGGCRHRPAGHLPLQQYNDRSGVGGYRFLGLVSSIIISFLLRRRKSRGVRDRNTQVRRDLRSGGVSILNGLFGSSLLKNETLGIRHTIGNRRKDLLIISRLLNEREAARIRSCRQISWG